MRADALEHLGADTFAKECAEGRAMSLADGASLAVEVFSSVRGPRGIQSA